MKAYIVLGDTYRDLEVYDKAYQFYLKVLQIAEKNKLTNKIGMFKEALGSVQFRLGNYDKSIQLYTESKNTFRKPMILTVFLEQKVTSLLFINTQVVHKKLLNLLSLS